MLDIRWSHIVTVVYSSHHRILDSDDTLFNQFAIEVKSDIVILFVSVLVIRKGIVLTMACRKPTHTGFYLIDAAESTPC
jgi:hypothetical protein